MEISKRSQLLFSTLRIETSTGSVGTGFLAEHPSSEGECYFLVTNRHVVNGSNYGSIMLNASFSNPSIDITLGEMISAEIKSKNWKWFTHPDLAIDLAVFDFTPIVNDLKILNLPAFGITMAVDHLPSEETIKEIDIGDSILFVGYPAGIKDFTNNLPLVRTGSIATLPFIKYDNKPVFLIDASVFPGSSGSPVFLKDDNDYNTFLGVLSAGFILNDETKEYLDFGVVHLSKTVFETIESYLHYYGKLSDNFERSNHDPYM